MIFLALRAMPRRGGQLAVAAIVALVLDLL